MKKRKNYIFTNRKNSNRAIMAVILGMISMISLGIVVFFTYRSGEATVGYGVTGLLAACFSLTGLILGILTVREKKYYRFFPLVAIMLNLLNLAEIILIIYVGVNWK